MSEKTEKRSNIDPEIILQYISDKIKYGKYQIAPLSERKRVVITDWNSEEGTKKLLKAKPNKPFFKLSHNYQSQINPFYCGVACIATILNTLRAKKGLIPNQKGFDYTKPNGEKVEYRYYNQLNILDENTDKIKQRKDIAPSIKDEKDNHAEFNPGLSISQLEEILNYHNVSSEKVIAEKEPEIAIDQFRQNIKEILQSKRKFMILNFDGKMCGLSTGGHFSTVGAYDDDDDTILILDAAAHKNPWFWVPVKHIYYAMNTKNDEGYRGYLIVWDEIDDYLSI